MSSALTKEFDPTDLTGAMAFVAELPQEVQRVYVDVWQGSDWRFVVGDHRSHVTRTIERVTVGQRFRIRAT